MNVISIEFRHNFGRYQDETFLMAEQTFTRICLFLGAH